MNWPATSPYALLNGVGFVVAIFLLERSLKTRLPERANLAYILLILAVPFGWVGAHALDCVVNDRPFMTAGFVFYGGLISAVLCFVIVRQFFLSTKELFIALNAAVIPAVVAHAIGRIGCFVAGCCYGTAIHGCPVLDRHPTQLYESAFLGLLAISLTIIGRRRPDSVLWVYLLFYPTFRFFIEFLRGDQRGGVGELSTSQLISIALVAVALPRWLIVVVRKPVAQHHPDIEPRIGSG